MATDINFTFLLIGFLPIALYALGGLWDAVNKGEKVNWPSFIKTLVVGLVTAGAISTQTADIINELAATTRRAFPEAALRLRPRARLAGNAVGGGEEVAPLVVAAMRANRLAVPTQFL